MKNFSIVAFRNLVVALAVCLLVAPSLAHTLIALAICVLMAGTNLPF